MATTVHVCVSLQPLAARIILLIQNAPRLRFAVTTGSTGTAGIKVVGITKDQSVVNVIFGLTVVIKETILEGLAIVTNLSSPGTGGELALVAFPVRVGAIFANVVGEFPVHSLQFSVWLRLLGFHFGGHHFRLVSEQGCHCGCAAEDHSGTERKEDKRKTHHGCRLLLFIVANKLFVYKARFQETRFEWKMKAALLGKYLRRLKF